MDNIKSETGYYIFVLGQHDGTIVVGQAKNAAKAIASFNGGEHSMEKGYRTVQRVIGVKPETEERTLLSTAEKFSERFGSERVLVLS